MGRVRRPAVAGSFYPSDGHALRLVVQECLADARESIAPGCFPKAIVVPHAGYMYSGPIAARAYRLLEPAGERVERVVLVGPSHRVPFAGLAVPSHNEFETPMGRVPVDDAARERVLSSPAVHILDDAHHWEHSLEVQLPFLQAVVRSFRVLPLVVGWATPAQVREVLDSVWGGEETVIVVSTDLSHYHRYEEARQLDAATAAAIERLDPASIREDDACGRIGLQGFLQSAREQGLEVHRLDLRNSGDTAGGRREVVGYGAWAFTAAKNGSP
jgi:AmmeMemoRadiSam system protein B